MATKPTETFLCATDTLFSSGDASGEVTKINPPGFPDCAQGVNIPGDPYVPEYLHKLLHITGNWITEWLDGGTSDPDADAHIVETDANGRISAALATVDTLTVDTELDVDGAEISGAVSVTGTATVAASATLASAATGTVSLAGPLVRSGDSARLNITGRVAVLTDASQDVAIVNEDIWVLPSSHAANRTYRTLTTPTPTIGEIAEFIRFEGAGANSSIIARVASAAAIVTLTGPGQSARIIYDGSNWRLLSTHGGTPGVDA